MSGALAGGGGEERLIASIASLWAGRGSPELALGGGDDCAVVRLPGAGMDLLLTSDQLVEGRHFVRGRHPPDLLGGKALVRSLSDIAAMGGEPRWCLQTVCLPAWAAGRWHDSFQRGFRRAADGAGAGRLVLAGGDVSGGDRFVAAATVIGAVERGSAILRSGARPGDTLYVSGRLGGSAAGLAMLLGEQPVDETHPAVTRHCAPRARLGLGRALRELRASAAIDLSDGLAADAGRMAVASGVALVIDPQALPLFPGTTPDIALSSGEEYELLCALPGQFRPAPGLDLTRIGSVEPGQGVWLRTSQGRKPLGVRGYDHFPG